jgi:hemoglobin
MTDSAQTTAPPPQRVVPFNLVGQEDGVRRLVKAFYDHMEQDPEFARLRSIHAPDLGPMRSRLADYLTQWMGGPRAYAERHPGRPCIVSAHGPFAIDGQMAEDWMACMGKAFATADVSPEFRSMVEPVMADMCQGLRNDQGGDACDHGHGGDC